MSEGWQVVAWDRRVARAAGVATLVTFGLAVVVTAAADEGGVAWGERLGRALAATPLYAGFGAWLALQARRARGELVALATLGRSPSRSSLPSCVGATVVAALITLTVGARTTFDAAMFFPVAHSSREVQFEAGAFVERDTGILVLPNGTIQLPVPKEASPPLGAAASLGPSSLARRSMVVAVSLLCSAALALLGARRTPRLRDLAAVCVSGAGSVLAFHAIAVGRLPSVVSILPTIALMTFAVLRYREDDPWQHNP